MPPAVSSAVSGASASSPLSDAEALAAAEAGPEEIERLVRVAGSVRDRAYGARLTFSPKVFLPLTNLCRNRCDYCSFRKSPGDAGAWTMTHREVSSSLAAARATGCAEALFCLGDKPEKAFSAYRVTLAERGHESTVEYLEWGAQQALADGLLPHTNAGVLSADEMARLRRCNVSLGLMLESISPRLCEKGMAHHRAPDKRPGVRMRMLEEAGALEIPFTTGILIGIGETRLERVQSLLAIRELHLRYGHIQEVIVQNFVPKPEIAMADVAEQADHEMLHAVALARLILPVDVSLQAPPNLNAARTAQLVAAGVNDFGGISPVTPDFINPEQPWPHLLGLRDACRALGFELEPRLAIYDRYLQSTNWLDASLRELVAACRERMTAGAFFAQQKPASRPTLRRRSRDGSAKVEL